LTPSCIRRKKKNRTKKGDRFDRSAHSCCCGFICPESAIRCPWPRWWAARCRKLRPAFTGPAAAGLEAIYSADNSFDPDEFARGAREAYKIIIAAFADGDRKALKPLLDDDVYEAWDEAITARESSGVDPFNLLRISKLDIDDAEMDGDTARVMIRYEAELGDGESVRTARDIWTFKRKVTSSDPNWLLDDVETAS